MQATTEPQTFAAFVACCATCGGEVTIVLDVPTNRATIQPCGHEPSVVIKPNPLLVEGPE